MGPKKKRNGLFLVFEGGEGTGKSTQIQRLAANLERRGLDTYITREPGGTPLGEALRKTVVENREHDLSDRAELLIYEASRAQLVDSVLLPKLAEGVIVLCDRFMDSSTVYQGIGKGLGRATTHTLNKFATAGLTPDLVFLLDAPIELSMRRVRTRKSAMTVWDRLDAGFHQKVRSGFLALARSEPRRFRIIDASGTEEQIESRIFSALEKRFPKKVGRRS